MGEGPSGEMRRFSAGIRVVTALICTVLLLATSGPAPLESMGLLLGYNLWSAYLLWAEATQHPRRIMGVWPYWLDVAWSCAAMKFFGAASAMMVLTLVHPVVLASIGFGVGSGVVLAMVAALGILYDSSSKLMQGPPEGWLHAVPLLLVLALMPAAAILARPMSVLRHRLALIVELEAQLDPRRGLEPICAELVERLRVGTRADVVALVLPSKRAAPAMLATSEDGAFRAKAEAHLELERLLANSPPSPVSYVVRRWWDPRPRLRVHGAAPASRELAAALATLAGTLDVRSLHIVPLTRYTHEHGHFVVGYGSPRSALEDISALSSAAPELLHVVEQAALVDQLQDESACLERARIGRDLHDSAIQPYLGLKYAVECVALRIAPDNPARADVDALAVLVNNEVSTLRELISSLRTGSEQGDNAFVPAVRRQGRRFSLLFGIDVEIASPEHLPTTRALAGALFHMVNEALNNIRKHTKARRVWIVLSVEEAVVCMVVRDDAGSVHGRPARDFRPVSLSERVSELGGTLEIARPDGLNTELKILIPL
jgi:signal transduction histidine kinase